MTSAIPILDMCCGSRMFWFDKTDARAVFLDARNESHTLCDGRALNISPDIIGDFRQLPFADNSFSVVVFDPPHLRRAGLRGWMRKKYGVLDRENWRADLTAGFREAFRVLSPGGVLIFKWNATQIPVSQIVVLTEKSLLSGREPEKQTKPTGLFLLRRAYEHLANRGFTVRILSDSRSSKFVT